MWPDFGKSVLMSHLATQIFMTKLRRRDIQTTLQWLQFVVQTLNYQKLCEIFWKFFYPLTYRYIELCNSAYFNVTLGLIFQNQVTYYAGIMLNFSPYRYAKNYAGIIRAGLILKFLRSRPHWSHICYIFTTSDQIWFCSHRSIKWVMHALIQCPHCDQIFINCVHMHVYTYVANRNVIIELISKMNISVLLQNSFRHNCNQTGFTVQCSLMSS